MSEMNHETSKADKNETKKKERLYRIIQKSSSQSYIVSDPFSSMGWWVGDKAGSLAGT
jgi:hypothetical protein